MSAPVLSWWTQFLIAWHCIGWISAHKILLVKR